MDLNCLVCIYSRDFGTDDGEAVASSIYDLRFNIYHLRHVCALPGRE